MKHLLTIFLALAMIMQGLSAQNGLVENFDDGDIVGWGGQADYKLTNPGSELRIGAHKTSTWNSFQYDFSAIDISANPYVSLKVKTDVDFNLNFSVWDDLGDNYAYPVNDGYQTIVHSDGYATYTFDFRNVTGVDLTRVHRLNFVFNPSGAMGCDATVYFDDLRIGDQALLMPSIARVEDQNHGLNNGEVQILLWGISDRETGAEDISITAVSSNPGLIPDPTIAYTPGNSEATLTYTPVTDQSGTAVITVTVSGNAPDDNVSTFNVTVETNKAPVIDQAADVNIQAEAITAISLSGMDDGDPNDNQVISLSASSSNTTILPDPVINYTPGEFSAELVMEPASGQTGTVTVTVTVQDDGGTIAGGVDQSTMSFDVNIYPQVNNPPVMNALLDISILQDDPEQTVLLRGISDGDDAVAQDITFTVVSSDPGLTGDPVVSYTQGSPNGSLSFTPVAGQTGTATITVTLTDNGGNANNNGNESTEYTFEVELRVRPILGWEDDFEDGILGPQWPADWGDPGEDTHLCTEQDGVMRIQVDKTRTNNRWAGLWFEIPTELNMSEYPYISITMKTDEAPKEMLIFLWDAYNHYNTAKTVRHTVTGDFVEYYFDYSDPSFQLQGDGTMVDLTRIKALLINFDPGGNSPLYVGSFYFDDFRVGDKAHTAPQTPDVTFANIPDFAVQKDSPEQSYEIANISDGGEGLNTVSLEAVSNNTSLIPNPVIEPVSGGKAIMRFTPAAGQTGTATITVNGTATGSNPLSKSFDISVTALDAATATDVVIDLSTTYQEIDGFGAFMGSGGTSPDTVIALAEDIGMSMARFGVIGGGFEKVNDNSDPYVLNLEGFNPNALSISNMKRIAPFVDKFIVTFWSPAGWMKLNKWENGVETYASDNKLDPNYYEEYAEEVIALIKVIKRETGKDVYGIGLQNEPQFNEPYPSCQVNPQEYRDLIKVVGPRLDAEGYGDVKLFWAEALPAQNSIDDYINAVKNDPIAESYADIVAIHNYDADGASVGGAGCDTWGDIFNWAQAGNYQYKTWMTETSGHADNWNGAMTLAGNIFNSLSCGNSSGWVFWSFTVTEGAPEYGLVVSNRPTSRYFVSKQYYKYIRPGAVRVDATSGDIPVIAFKHDVDKTVSVVLFNNTDQVKTLEIKGAGLPSQWKVYTTSESRNCEQQADVGPDGLIILPPSSLTTLVGDNSNPAPTLDDIADVHIDENTGPQTVSLTGISDGEGTSQVLTFEAVSDNPDLIPNPTVNYVQGAGTAVLNYTPVTDKTGEAVISVTVTDDGTPLGTVTKSFTIYVAGVNYPPEIDDVATQSVLEDGGPQTVDLTGINDGNPTETQSLTITASSSNTSVIPDPAIDFTNGNSFATLSYTPEADANGTVTITVTLTDNGSPAEKTEITFDIQVEAVNDAPSIDDISDPADIDQNSGEQSVNISGISDGDDGSQQITVTAESNNTTLIPQVEVDYTSGSTGTLRFTPATGETGTATVTVTVQDDGGTANGGTNSNSTSFMVTVIPTGINLTDAGSIRIYPNPASEVLHVTFDQSVYSRFIITDVSGRVLKEIEVQIGDNKLEVKLQGLSSGMYILTGESGKGLDRIQFVIE